MLYVRRKNLIAVPTFMAVVMCAVMVVFVSSSQAEVTSGSIRLSTHSSNGGGPVPDPCLLDALYTFEVDDIAETLTLTVDNLTPEDPCDPWFKISQVFFNVESNITDLDLTAVIGSDIAAWNWDNGPQGSTFDPDGHQVDGFGLFDVALRDGQGDTEENVIDPGETVEFVFDIFGVGPFSASNFITMSTQVDTHIISYGAGKFFNGAPEFTGFGATDVPEPMTICLFGLGGLALLRKRRK